MTKLEVLLTYSPVNVFNSWYALGKNEINSNTKIYASNIIYRVDIPKSAINNILLFCKQDYSGKLDWSKASLINAQGEITFGNSIISPYFQQVLSASELQSVIDAGIEPDPDFIPYADIDTTGEVIIPEDIYRICMTDIGYPFITEDDLGYTREQICELAIKPAFIEYFKWFPKVEVVSYPITGKVQTIQFPSDAYSYVDFSIKKGPNSSSGSGVTDTGITNTFLRFIDEYLYMNGYGYASSWTGTYSGMYSPQTYTNTMDNMLTQRAAIQGIENYLHNYECHTVYNSDGTRSIQFYSNKMGAYAQVAWAKKSYNWNDTQLARQPELIELIKANIKLLFANLRRQAKDDIPGKFDYKDWINEANTTKENVTKEWKSIVKYAMIQRGSK